MILFYFFPALIFVQPHLHTVFFSKPLHLLSSSFFFFNSFLSAKDCSLTLKCPSPASLPPTAFFFHPLFLIACAREQRREKERIPSLCEIQETERKAGRQSCQPGRVRLNPSQEGALNTWDSPPPLRLLCHAIWLWSYQPSIGLPCRNVAFGICCPRGMKQGSDIDQNRLLCQPRLLTGSCAHSPPGPGPTVNPLCLSQTGV